MKIEALKEYIKKSVQQEVRNVLREELKYHLTEIILGNSSPNVITKNISTQSDVKEEVKKESPKKIIKYTNNQILNDVLNETRGFSPSHNSDTELVGLIDDGFSSNNQTIPINEVKIPENATEPVKTAYKAITRDYRSLLKAIENKKTK